MTRRIPQRIGNPNVQPMVRLSNFPESQTDRIYSNYINQPGKYRGNQDLVELIACQAGDPNCGANVLDMLAQSMYGANYDDISAVGTLMGRNPMMQDRIRRKVGAPVVNAYYQMRNIGLPKEEMLTGRDRLRTVSDMLRTEGIEKALRAVPLAGTAAAGLGTLAAVNAVTESPEERQIREALAAIEYMRG